MNWDDRLSRILLRLASLSTCWLVLGILLLLHHPWEGLDAWPLAGATVPLAVTTLCLIGNLSVAGWILSRTGRLASASPCLILFVALYVLLFAQVGCCLGMEHYRFDEMPPPWWDWLRFPAVEALRAADLLDLLDTYGFLPQAIHPASRLTLALVLTYRLVLALVTVIALVNLTGRLWRGTRWFFSVFPRAAHSVFAIPGLFLIFGIVTTILGIVISTRSDLQRNTLDAAALPGFIATQLLHVVDLPDVMPAGDARLDRLPGYWWLTFEGILLRLGFALLVGGVLSRLFQDCSLRWLGGRGLSDDLLDDLNLHHRWEDYRVLAYRRMFLLFVEGEPRLWPCFLVLGGGLVAVLLLSAIRPHWDEAALMLANHAIVGSEESSARSLAKLRRLGPYGGSAAGVLGVGYRSVNASRGREFLATLGFLGPRAIPVLQEMLDEKNPVMQATSSLALARVGPSAIPTLVAALNRAGDRQKAFLQEALLAVGAEGVPALLAVLTPPNAPELVPLLEKMDARWYLRDISEGPARDVRTARISLAMLTEPHQLPDNLEFRLGEKMGRMQAVLTDPAQLAPHLIDLGPISTRVVPILLRQLEADQTSFGMVQLLGGLERLGPHAVQAVPDLRRLASRNLPGQDQIARTLDRLDPGWRR